MTKPVTSKTSSRSSSARSSKPVKKLKVAAAPRSALHKWTPDVNKAKAAAIDKKLDSFACAVGGASPSKKVTSAAEEESKDIAATDTMSGVKDYKMDIVGELTKLLNIYKASNDRGKVMGYQRAISHIKAYD